MNSIHRMGENMTSTKVYNTKFSDVAENNNTKIERLDKLANWLDSRFTLPWLNIKLGWDTIIGLIPFIGDSLTTLLGAYIIREAHTLNIPKWVLFVMMWNLFVDWIFGSIPLVGDLFDIGWKANVKNISLIRKHALR